MNSYIRLLPALFPYVCRLSFVDANRATNFLTTSDVTTSFAITACFDDDGRPMLWLSKASRDVLARYPDMFGGLDIRMTEPMRAEKGE